MIYFETTSQQEFGGIDKLVERWIWIQALWRIWTKKWDEENKMEGSWASQWWWDKVSDKDVGNNLWPSNSGSLHGLESWQSDPKLLQNRSQTLNLRALVNLPQKIAWVSCFFSPCCGFSLVGQDLVALTTAGIRWQQGGLEVRQHHMRHLFSHVHSPVLT